MINEAKSRQVRYEDTMNNFFNTLTSGYQAFQGAMKTNPFGGAQPTGNTPYQSNFGGYGAPQGAHGGYGAQGGYGASNFGGAPQGYGQQPGYGQNAQFGNTYPSFPLFPGQNYPHQGGQGGQHRGY